MVILFPYVLSSFKKIIYPTKNFSLLQTPQNLSHKKRTWWGVIGDTEISMAIGFFSAQFIPTADSYIIQLRYWRWPLTGQLTHPLSVPRYSVTTLLQDPQLYMGTELFAWEPCSGGEVVSVLTVWAHADSRRHEYNTWKGKVTSTTIAELERIAWSIRRISYMSFPVGVLKIYAGIFPSFVETLVNSHSYM